MSKKSGKLDLLVRVRYQNPLPPPPYPPKLLKIPTDINRLGEPSYLNHLAATTPLPMLVDAEMGMPLDLNQYEGAWDGRYDSLNPRPDAGRVMHPTDLALLAPLNNTGKPLVNGTAGSTIRDVKIRPEDLVTLRTSSAKQKRALGKRRSTYGDIARTNQDVDASETAQIMAIDGTFFDLTGTHLDNFKHPDPKKKDLRVVESYDILPDDETFGNPYFVIKYPERPSAAILANPTAVPSSPRLRRAVARPTTDADGADIIDYFLVEEDDLSRVDEVLGKPWTDEQLAETEVFDAPDADEEEINKRIPNVHYERIRSYEIASHQPDITKEVLLTIVEGGPDDEVDTGEGPAKKKRKGGYITPIAGKVLLRKTRAKRRDEEDARENVWDKIRLGSKLPCEQEATSRQDKKDPIVNFHWTDEQRRKLNGGESLAVGEGEAINEDDAAGDAEDV